MAAQIAQGRYKVTPPTLADGQTTDLQVDVNGKLITSGSGGGSSDASAANQTSQITQETASATSLAIMDDWDETDRAKVNLIVGQAGIAGGTGTDGATVPRVSLATNVALPAGTNAIGKLAANSGVDIGDIDVTSIIPGTGATNLGKAADSVAGATDTGVVSEFIRDDVLTTITPADGDYAPARVDAYGAQWVVIENGAGGALTYNANGPAAAANSSPVTASTEDVARIGIITETAPASDTASSGLNGRLQRIAQRITSMIALLPGLGTAGTANSNVITVQGISSMTPVQVNPTPYPAGAIPFTASTTGTTASTVATLTGAASTTMYISGLSVRANATAATTGNIVVSGTITGSLNFTQWTAPLASGLGITEMIFNPPIPASAQNTSIVVTSAAPGSGGVISVSAWGYKI